MQNNVSFMLVFVINSICSDWFLILFNLMSVLFLILMGKG
ncbi:hypothetical protein N175_17325 [Vibrio anguillarum M3]|nr:hypothetical protein N175_17325 [Vibrio anguillarum M3]